MSHFSVAVFSRYSEEVEKLLEPFNECTEDSQYLEWETDEDNNFDEERGECGFYHNPNAKWDWWEMGGRFSDKLKLKEGCKGKSGERSWMNKDEPTRKGYCDQARVRDVDFVSDPEVYQKAIRIWEILMEKEDTVADDYFIPFFSREELQEYKNKEEFASNQAQFDVWAFLTPDGEWIEKGEMGWFGLGDDTEESSEAHHEELMRFIEDNPDLYITIVDCHI